MFTLHPRLDADTLPVTTLELCSVRLMNDRRFPWVILIPQREDVTEVHHLAHSEQAQLMSESSRIAATLEDLFVTEKINVGALGNRVPQLHWHVVARIRTDPCWPGPVWSCGKPEPYASEAGARRVASIRNALR